MSNNKIVNNKRNSYELRSYLVLILQELDRVIGQDPYNMDRQKYYDLIKNKFGIPNTTVRSKVFKLIKREIDHNTKLISQIENLLNNENDKLDFTNEETLIESIIEALEIKGDVTKRKIKNIAHVIFKKNKVFNETIEKEMVSEDYKIQKYMEDAEYNLLNAINNTKKALTNYETHCASKQNAHARYSLKIGLFEMSDFIKSNIIEETGFVNNDEIENIVKDNNKPVSDAEFISNLSSSLLKNFNNDLIKIKEFIITTNYPDDEKQKIIEECIRLNEIEFDNKINPIKRDKSNYSKDFGKISQDNIKEEPNDERVLINKDKIKNMENKELISLASKKRLIISNIAKRNTKFGYFKALRLLDEGFPVYRKGWDLKCIFIMKNKDGEIHFYMENENNIKEMYKYEKGIINSSIKELISKDWNIYIPKYAIFIKDGETVFNK